MLRKTRTLKSSNEKINKLTSVFSKETFMQLIPFIHDEKVDFDDKLFCIHYLLLTNDENALINIEKFMLKILDNPKFDDDLKLKNLDDFTYQRSGNMPTKTVQWIYTTSIDLFWKLFHISSKISCKVQCGQFIFRNEAQNFMIQGVYTKLSELLQNVTYEEKADIADLFLHANDQNIRREGTRILQLLQFNQRSESKILKTIYSDKQNVHSSDITKSVNESLEKLMQDVVDSKMILISPLETIDEIKDILTEKKLMNNKIEISLKRIITDQAYFTQTMKLRLRDIVQRVWFRICKMPDEMQNEALTRLANELYDSSGLCSTGHMSRIVNVLSGFPEKFGGLCAIKISWSQQISANIAARINSRIKNLNDEELQGQILIDMLDTETKENTYKKYQKTIRKEIYDELYQEFSPHFSVDNSFDKEIFDQVFDEFFV